MEMKYINTSFSDKFEKVNEEFLKCTVSIMSYDQIANGTKFTKQSIINALPTLNYSPVIGYFNGEDFEGHGQEMVWTDDGIEFIVKTIPFGVMIKDSARFEYITKDNGEKEEYLVADCYLWSRYEDAINIVKENKCNQSMEVMVNDCSYKDNYLEIRDFNFSGVCILGENVNPAFKLAKIRTVDKFSKDNFKGDYQEMLSSLDKFLNFEEGGSTVEENKELVIENEETNTEKIVDETMSEEIVDKSVEISTEEETSSSQDFESLYNEMLVSYGLLEKELSEVKSSYSEIEKELKILKEYKDTKEFEMRKSKEDELFSKFEEISENEDFLELQKDAENYSLEDLEVRLFAILGKSKFNAKKSNKKQETKAVFNHVETSYEDEKPKSKYEKLIKKYL